MYVGIPTLCEATGVKGLALSADYLGIILYSLRHSGFFEPSPWPLACVNTRSCLLFVTNREENRDTCHRTPELFAVAIIRY